MGIKCPKCGAENPDTSTFCSDCGTKLLTQKDIEVTETLETPKEELTRGTIFAGRYEIIEELGKGGMGRVYRVEDTKLEQEVALKLIIPEVAKDKKTIERFRNELKLARNIRHKNVCGQFDLGETEGAHFITMEYVDGEDLKSMIRMIGKLSTGKAISIAKQVCEGLAEAHDLGVVHRDLKPSNIMIDKFGNAKIMDFGIARSQKARGMTGTGVMIGTPEYMSPEQIEAKDIDQRSDIYSLGIIMYKMLTGRLPFEADTPFALGVKHKSEVPKNPTEFNPQIPEDLSKAILKCLEKEKNSRYQATANNTTHLYLRPIDQFDSAPLPGTENAEDPFFSPDGHWVGFFQAGMLKKLRIGSASPVTLCKGTPQPMGATWGTDGSIIFGGTTPGLTRVTDTGGTPQEITTPNPENNETHHRFPQMLPGEKTLLFQVDYAGGNYPRIAVLSLDKLKWKIILEEESRYPSYSPSGHIIYTQSSILMAVPFDLKLLEISGVPFSVLENIWIPRNKPINICFSQEGTLAYVSRISEETENQLVWVNFEGQSKPPKQELLSYTQPRISPDGKKIAMELDRVLYVYELERNIKTELIPSKSGADSPVWSPDGKMLAFTSSWKRGGTFNTIHLISIDGSKEVDDVYDSEFTIFPASWSSDGLWITFYEINPNTQRDIWVLSLKDRTAKPIIATQYNERVPMFSPDGRFIAYVSNDTGRDEIYVQPFPTTGAKWKVSRNGGREPFWDPGRSKLYYRVGNKMMSVDIESGPTFKWGEAQLVFEGNFFSHLNNTNYCVTPNGDQFMMVKPRGELVVKQINVVISWFEELKRLSPSKK